MFCQRRSRGVTSNSTALNPSSRGTCSSAGGLFGGMLSPDPSPAVCTCRALLRAPRSCSYARTGTGLCGACLRDHHSNIPAETLCQCWRRAAVSNSCQPGLGQKVLLTYQHDMPPTSQLGLLCMHKSRTECREHKKEKKKTIRSVSTSSSHLSTLTSCTKCLYCLQNDTSLLQACLSVFIEVEIEKLRN